MSERRERLGQILFAEGVQIGRDEGSFAPGDEPTWDSIGVIQQMFYERKAEAVAAAVDAEYAPLLALLEQRLRAWNRHGMTPADFSDIADRLESLRIARGQA